MDRWEKASGSGATDNPKESISLFKSSDPNANNVGTIDVDRWDKASGSGATYNVEPFENGGHVSKGNGALEKGANLKGLVYLMGQIHWISQLKSSSHLWTL